MTTTSPSQDTTREGRLHMALELADATWKIGFADSLGRAVRVRTIPGGHFGRLEEEISKAKKAFGLPEDAKVISCYEAGREGFWVHRALMALDIESHIVDPASIQVSRKRRRAKTDRIDAEKIVNALMRFKAGDRFACRMIRIPDLASEDERNLNRELKILRKERTAHVCRIKSLLFTQGIREVKVDRTFVCRLEQMQCAHGEPLGKRLQDRLLREFDRLVLVTEQIRTLQMLQVKLIRIAANTTDLAEAEAKTSRAAVIAEHLSNLGGIGAVTGWTLATEIFSWRDITNRRQLAALVGLTPTPNASGGEEKEQGISKSGRGELRVLMIEIAWGWLLHQPESELAKWYQKRFNDGTSRNRKIGIVALARKLLVALGKFVRHGEVPPGAKLKTKSKFNYMPSLQPKTTGQAA